MLDQDRAALIVAQAYSAGRELNCLRSLLRDDDAELSDALATSIYEVMEIASRIMDRFPQLREEVEGRIAEDGRAF